MSDIRLSIIVPIYNEERTLVSVIQKLHDVFQEQAEIIFVDDGSKDSSLDILHKHTRKNDIVLTKKNGGKGSAVRTGIAHAHAPFICIQDADLEYDPEEILTLLAFAMQHHRTIVFGSRFLKKNPNLYKRYLLGNKVMTAFLNMLFGANLTDSYTCYKLFPREILQSLPLSAGGFELEAELCALPLKLGFKILELPISYHPRSIEEGKKIKFADAWKGLYRMAHIRFSRSVIPSLTFEREIHC